MKVYLIILVFLSLFVGIPVNDDWWIVSREEFIGMSEGFTRAGTWFEWLFYIPLVISHLVVISTLFINDGRYVKRVIEIVPLIYFLLFCILDFVGALMLIPFMIWWFVCLVQSRKFYKREQSNKRELKSEI